ncbi:MAG: class I SAM-dependent methyltransferase [Polyangiaceae bacterium]
MSYAMRCAFRTRTAFLERVGIGRGSHVLDYGCATGLFVRYLRKHGYRAEGFDPNVEEFRDTSLREGTYDAVVSYDVIEHVEKPEALLGRLASLIKPGGRLVIGTPDASKIDLAKPEKYAFELHQPYHVHILSGRQLMRLAERANLRPLSVRNRFCYDTIYPFVNTQFIWRYARACDNTLDSTLDIPRRDVLWRQPSLLFWALCGYFYPHRGSLVAAFEKPR